MSRVFILVIVMSAFIFMYAPLSHSQTLRGSSGSSSRWGSGWLDLNPAVDFQKGEKLKLTIGGTARRILVRLLREGDDPNDKIGILGIFNVPSNSIVEVTLPDNRNRVKQISVHGSHPWDYDLGENNGPATLQGVERIR